MRTRSRCPASQHLFGIQIPYHDVFSARFAGGAVFLLSHVAVVLCLIFAKQGIDFSLADGGDPGRWCKVQVFPPCRACLWGRDMEGGESPLESDRDILSKGLLLLTVSAETLNAESQSRGELLHCSPDRGKILPFRVFSMIHGFPDLPCRLRKVV